MIVSIHQPNFMPWLPWFEKMRRSDLFVFLNHCQWEKGGYQNRFSMGGQWYTMSTNKKLINICDKQYLDPPGDWRRIKDRLPQHESILDQFDGAIATGRSMGVINSLIAVRLAQILGIKTTVGTDGETGKTGTGRLLDICQHYGATTYLSGPSGRGYLDTGMFERAGIAVEFFDVDASVKVPVLEAISNGV